MLDNIPDEYEIDPGTDIDRLADIFLDKYPDADDHTVDEAIFVDDGPVDHLTWVSLDGYSQHEFFYRDPDPDDEVLRRLLSISPSEKEMKLLRAYLSKHFAVIESVEHIAFLTIPDTYLPGSKPRANVAFYQNPVGEQIDVGINATPLSHEKEILSDADRLVPARDLETFARDVITAFYAELEETAETHLIEGDIRSVLDQDPDFRRQTVKPLPDGIHPVYTGDEAELWQKPISQEPAIEGSHGFVQVWVPDDERAGFVFLTDGDYEQERPLDDVRRSLESALD
ncbi:hypothetical protein [Halosimplex halophilum]|uniref:hypothetical protein n=1 Tax=Halosimplex halophilum TaxID=2559572 RepID=UPI00107F2E21|nr:hypothetical protein [Halosimplex halophilum]